MRDTRIMDQSFQTQDSAISLGRVLFYAIATVFVIYLGIALTNYFMRDRMVERMVMSFNDGNLSLLARSISWPELQANLKERIIDKTQAAREVGNSRFPSAQLSPEQIYKIVDYYIQPGAMDIMMRLKNAYAPTLHPKQFIKGTGFNGLAGFTVNITHPEPSRGNKFMRSQEVKIYLELRGLEWKVVDADIPLVFIPTYIPNK